MNERDEINFFFNFVCFDFVFFFVHKINNIYNLCRTLRFDVELSFTLFPILFFGISQFIIFLNSEV